MDTKPQDERPFNINEITADQFKLLIDKMLNGFALHKIIVNEKGEPVDYEFLEINPAFEQKTGLKREDVLGKRITEILPGTEKDPENFIKLYGDVALGGEPVYKEIFSQALNKWFLISVYSPQKYYFVVMMKDINDQKRNEKILLNNERRLRLLLDIIEYKTGNIQEFLDYSLHKAIELTESQIGYIYLYDEKTKLFTLNSWSREVMKLCTVRESMTVYELDKTGIWGEVVRQRKPILVNDFAATNPLKKGTPEGHAPMKNFMSIPVFHNDDIVAVVGMANKASDFDDNDVLQLELLMENVWKIVMVKKTEEKLLKEENKFKKYFEKSPQGIFVIDEEGNVKDLNPRVVEMMGYPKEELIGQNFTKFIFQDSLEAAQKAFSNLKESGFTQGDYNFITKDGRRSSATVKAIRIEDGTLLGFIDDINDQLKAIADLKASNQELQRINSLVVNRELKMVQLKNKLTELGIDPNSI